MIKLAYYDCTKCGHQHQSVSTIGMNHWKYRSRVKTIDIEGMHKAKEEMKKMAEENELEPLFSVSVSVNKRLLNHDLLELILAYALGGDEEE